jgi:peptidoglycan/LPS O-acetylase OafA/YrhL
VVGLREGLEAALIVGIIAAFLGQQGRRDALRQVWLGTAAAVAICIGIAIALQVISSGLPQQQQEGLETVVGALAVGMVRASKPRSSCWPRSTPPATPPRPGWARRSGSCSPRPRATGSTGAGSG